VRSIELVEDAHKITAVDQLAANMAAHESQTAKNIYAFKWHMRGRLELTLPASDYSIIVRDEIVSVGIEI